MKTAVSMPDPLFRAADRAARKLSISRSELYRRAVAAFVKQLSDDEITRRMNEAIGEIGEDNDDTAEFRRRATKRAFERLGRW